MKAPFAAVVMIDTKVSDDWRNTVSEWLVEKGCLYMMAHGDDCSLWNDSLDWAILTAYKFGGIPEDKFVMTSWHEDQNLEEVFFFAINSLPFYPLIKHTVILDVADTSRDEELLRVFSSVKQEIDEENKIDERSAGWETLAGIIGTTIGTLAVPFLF